MSSAHPFRKLLERLSRGIVLRRRLPPRFGRAMLHVSPGAALAYYRKLEGPAWRELYEFAEHIVQPGTVVWDLGASMGVFAFAAAHRAGSDGSVLAVEADTWAAELLKGSAREPRTGAAPVRVLCAAVGRALGLEPFHIASRSRAGSHLESSPGASAELIGATREAHPTLTVTIDWLATHHPKPAAIKLDLEGSELDALQGATATLEKYRPALFLEVFERNADAVTALLHRCGYDLWELSGGWNNRQRIGRAGYNTLALPR